MALWATHLTYALDLKDLMNVQNMDEYMSGTVYPDSRYVSKIRRDMTHAKGYESPEFYNQSDFNKGWAIHLLCDIHQYHTFRDTFSDRITYGEEIRHGNQIWCETTALKILQDIVIFEESTTKDYLHCLDVVHTPNDEDHAVVKKFNTLVQEFYKQESLTPESYLALFHDLGVKQEVAERTIDIANKLRQQSSKEEFRRVYETMLQSVQEQLTSNT